MNHYGYFIKMMVMLLIILFNLFQKKVSIGKAGSGTRDLAIDILKDNGIDETNTTILDYDSSKAKEELLNGNIDAMFIVTAHNSDTVKELLADPKINVLSFKRARAYSRKYTFFGSFNFI